MNCVAIFEKFIKLNYSSYQLGWSRFLNFFYWFLRKYESTVCQIRMNSVIIYDKFFKLLKLFT